MQRTSPRPLVTTVVTLVSGVVFFAFIFGRTIFAATHFISNLSFMPEQLTTPREWYRLVSSTITHENAFFLLVSVLFLVILGGPFERRQGTRQSAAIFIGSTAVALVIFSFLAWGKGLAWSGAFAGVGGLVGAWVVEAQGRRRISTYKNVIFKDFEELPAALVVVLWFLSAGITIVLFAPLMMPYLIALGIATITGGVIHFACTKRRGTIGI